MVAGAESDYWANELEPVAVCPVCGGIDAPVKYSGLCDHVENVPGQWSLRSCANCGCLFLDPRPRVAAIGKAYRVYYTHESAIEAHHHDNGQSFLWRLVNGYLNSCYGAQRLPASRIGYGLIPLLFPLKLQLDFFFRHLPACPGRLLDVGCGNGAFLLRAREAGWTVFGVEPDQLAVRAAREAGINVVEGTFEAFILDMPFNVITASHVIEHVPDPLAFLQKIFACLAPGGNVWLATPNVNSLGHAWFGSAWRGLEPPRHFALFSAKAIEQLLANAGFTEIKLRRRGRGAKYILNASSEIAVCQGRRRPWRLPTAIVDAVASFVNSAAEELVLTAKRPV